MCEGGLVVRYLGYVEDKGYCRCGIFFSVKRGCFVPVILGIRFVLWGGLLVLGKLFAFTGA